MFWGTVFGWEVATGYPWGFWQGPGYDLIEEGKKRFLEKTANIRRLARELGIKLCHEIHPGTAAQCSYEFNCLVDLCDGDECLAVNADPSHCWDGESWEVRFLNVGDRIYGCHVKNHVIRDGFPLRWMMADWKHRGMQFVDLSTGAINLRRYAELMLEVGYPQRYCELMGTETAPLVVEAESAFGNLDEVSAQGIEYVQDELCFEAAEQSFEKGMGDQTAKA
jgi:sugar phosphate isomerase/epimerase